MTSSKGFSLIELLAATVILGVLITAVLAPLTQLFERSSRNSQTLQGSSQAQNVLEFIKGQWRSYPRNLVLAPDGTYSDANALDRAASVDRYDRNCYSAAGLTSPSRISYTVVTRAVDRSGVAGAVLPLSTNCATAALSANPPLMKRIIVTVTDADNQQSVLSVDVPRP